MHSGAAASAHGKKRRDSRGHEHGHHHHHHHHHRHRNHHDRSHGDGPETDGANDDEKGTWGARGGNVHGGGSRHLPRGKHGHQGSVGGAKGRHVGSGDSSRHPGGGQGQRPHNSPEGDESHARRRNAVAVLDSAGASANSQSADHLHRNSRDDDAGHKTPSTGRRRPRTMEAGTGNGQGGPGTNYSSSQLERGGREGQANDDAARLRATVERLESELHFLKSGMGAGGGAGYGVDGFGMGRGHGGVPFGPGSSATAGSQWMPGRGAPTIVVNHCCVLRLITPSEALCY